MCCGAALESKGCSEVLEGQEHRNNPMLEFSRSQLLSSSLIPDFLGEQNLAVVSIEHQILLAPASPWCVAGLGWH